MGRLAVFDADGVARLMRDQDGVICRAQAVALGMTAAAIRHRLRPEGPWQLVLPGVYLARRSRATARQRAVAAFMFAQRQSGEAIAVTSQTALAWHGIRTGLAAAEGVDVLVPARCRRRDAGFARLRPTAVMPVMTLRDGPACYVPAARAIADTVRQLADLAAVRVVVAAGVQQRRVTVNQLAAELLCGPVQRSALFRQALADVAVGARSVAEADFVALIRRARLPVPMLNPRLFTGQEFIASPDAWWPEAGVAAEVDSREWHFSPESWAATMARHARMSAHGIIVLHFPPSRIRADGAAVAAEIHSALNSAAGRPPPAIQAVPSASRNGSRPGFRSAL